MIYTLLFDSLSETALVGSLIWVLTLTLFFSLVFPTL